ncbi:MAG: hypothetical protein DRO93_13765 [Candidatus Thorarchaeota archaeon]|nr:MAG: hypothetical protein DRO93_13765 [Candidatus Thorarchaeota archaeon]
MSVKNASLATLREDLKVGFGLAAKNIISFVLAMVGVLIVAGLLLAVIVICMIAVILIAAGGTPGIIQLFITLSIQWNASAGVIVIGTALLVVLPVLLPFFVAGGAIFGMGREVIESNGTTVEGVFVWYKSKFVPLALGGIIAFLIEIGPPALLSLVLASTSAGVVVDGPLVVLSVFSAVWWLLTSGMLSMLFPAIIDGHSVIEALRVSIRLATKYVDRVLSTWLALVIMAALLASPLLLLSLPFGPFFHPLGAGSYAVLFGIVFVFLLVPAASITLNRVYLILSGEDHARREDDTPGIDIVGGV